MPNTYIENRERWLDLSDVDYLGQFVKAWLAFNAWYRNAYTATQDRVIINDIKWQPNVIRNKLVPLLVRSDEESLSFRGHIGALHHRLENYHLHSGKGDEKERISLKNIFLMPNPSSSRSENLRGIAFSVVRGGSSAPANQVVSSVINTRGTNIFSFTQSRYNLSELESNSDFVNLSAFQQGSLRSLYIEVNPKLIVDLTSYNQPPISIGAYQFCCSAEQLFAGICEVIYLMRCTLFHGELVPSREASACYEPAYHIVRKFLTSIL